MRRVRSKSNEYTYSTLLLPIIHSAVDGLRFIINFIDGICGQLPNIFIFCYSVFYNFVSNQTNLLFSLRIFRLFKWKVIIIMNHFLLLNVSASMRMWKHNFVPNFFCLFVNATTTTTCVTKFVKFPFYLLWS